MLPRPYTMPLPVHTCYTVHAALTAAGGGPDIGGKDPTGGTNEPKGMVYEATKSRSASSTETVRSYGSIRLKSSMNSGTNNGMSEMEILVLHTDEHMGRRVMDITTTSIDLTEDGSHLV